MRENSSKKNKIQIKDKKKFLTFIFVCLLAFITIIILILNIASGNKNDSLSSIDSKKNTKELASKYESIEMKENFIKDYNEISSKVGIYLMSNITTEKESFYKVVNDLNDILKSNDWSKIELNRNNIWNGIWSLDGDGSLKFKFSLKTIEPSWVNDADLRTKLYIN